MRFESDVISDGTQTQASVRYNYILFESDVISDGTQTFVIRKQRSISFESDVISDGTQTGLFTLLFSFCLRVM